MRKIPDLLLIVIAFILIVIILRSPYSRLDRFGFADIDWADTVFYNNNLYTVEYIEDNYPTRQTIEEIRLDELLGKVKFNISKHVGNMHYKNRNWDATYLKKGAKIFSINNVDSGKEIAIQSEGKYIVYSRIE